MFVHALHGLPGLTYIGALFQQIWIFEPRAIKLRDVFVITIYAELHGFTHPMDLIPEFDEDVVSITKPK